MAYEQITDEELDDIFRDLDFNQLRELGYYLIDEISDQEELEDFLEAIDEDFSQLSRQEKIEELGGQIIEAYGDSKESAEDFDAESKKKKLTKKQKHEILIAKAIRDVDDMRDLYAEWGGMNLAMSLDEMEELIRGRKKDAEEIDDKTIKEWISRGYILPPNGDPTNPEHWSMPPQVRQPHQLKKKDRWTPGKGMGELPTFSPIPTVGPTVIKPKKDFGVDAYDEKMTIWICRACNSRFEDQNDAEACCEGMDEDDIYHHDPKSREGRKVHLQGGREGDWRAESFSAEIVCGTGYRDDGTPFSSMFVGCGEPVSEGVAKWYEQQVKRFLDEFSRQPKDIKAAMLLQGQHEDGSHIVAYCDACSKTHASIDWHYLEDMRDYGYADAESFSADSPFNTMLLIRDDVIIDQEDNFEYLLSIFMELENDLRELEEGGSQKHPFYEEMRRYRIQIADRLDALQEEVELKPAIEMDAEAILLEKPVTTGFQFGLGVIGSTLFATLVMGLIAAWFVNEE